MALNILSVVDCGETERVIAVVLIDDKDVNPISFQLFIDAYKVDNPEYNWTDFLGYLDSKNIPYLLIHMSVVKF